MQCSTPLSRELSSKEGLSFGVKSPSAVDKRFGKSFCLPLLVAQGRRKLTGIGDRAIFGDDKWMALTVWCFSLEFIRIEKVQKRECRIAYVCLL